MLRLFLWLGTGGPPAGGSLLIRLIIPPVYLCFLVSLGVMKELICPRAPAGVIMGFSPDGVSPLRPPYLLAVVAIAIVWRLVVARSCGRWLIPLPPSYRGRGRRMVTYVGVEGLVILTP